jgi:hypothetical protein
VAQVTKLVAALMLLVVALTGCGTSGTDETDTRSEPTPSGSAALLLDFESGGLEIGADVTSVENAGTAAIDVRATGEAAIEVVPAPGAGHAVRFPRYTGAAVAPAAVLVADDPGGALDPGDDDFTFGASFQLDEESSGSKADNGDNLVQRGTFDSPAQIKIQLDKGVPSCRVLGPDGEVFVQADGPVDPGPWYTVTCERRSDEVILQVEADGGASGDGTWRKSGPTGAVSFEDLPLTIGGKTAPDGTPVASADQFNGAVDDVFLTIG